MANNIPYKIYLEEHEMPKHMYAYERFHDGKMENYVPTDEEIQKGLSGIPQFPGNAL